MTSQGSASAAVAFEAEAAVVAAVAFEAGADVGVNAALMMGLVNEGLNCDGGLHTKAVPCTPGAVDDGPSAIAVNRTGWSPRAAQRSRRDR